MSIKVRYFASLADLVGRPEGSLAFDQPMTVRSVWLRDAGDKAIPGNLLIAINLEYAALDDEVNDGDEVAFFPPVTGG
jgi:molybdopterin synthase sulfur carrier subunit